jgi:hypothetical protein
MQHVLWDKFSLKFIILKTFQFYNVLIVSHIFTEQAITHLLGITMTVIYGVVFHHIILLTVGYLFILMDINFRMG